MGPQIRAFSRLPPRQRRCSGLSCPAAEHQSPDLISAPHTCSSNNNLLPRPTQFPEMHGLLLKPPGGKACQPARRHQRGHRLPAAGKRQPAASPARRHLRENKGLLGGVEGEGGEAALASLGPSSPELHVLRKSLSLRILGTRCRAPAPGHPTEEQQPPSSCRLRTLLGVWVLLVGLGGKTKPGLGGQRWGSWLPSPQQTHTPHTPPPVSPSASHGTTEHLALPGFLLLE